MHGMPQHITRESGKDPQYSIIWLHGLGADSSDFVPVADALQLPAAVRYIFPDAPVRPVAVNGGMRMRAWYDIAGVNLDAQQDEAGIRASQLLIEVLIAQEVQRGVAQANIFLAGFSQGGAIALHTAIRQPVPLGGVLALSTYLPLGDLALREAQAATTGTPIFMAHGLYDPVVPCQFARASRDALSGAGYTVEWHEYDMQHTVNQAELSDIQTWLGKQMHRE